MSDLEIVYLRNGSFSGYVKVIPCTEYGNHEVIGFDEEEK